MENGISRRRTLNQSNNILQEAYFAVCPFLLEINSGIDYIFTLNFQKGNCLINEDCQIIGELSTLIYPQKGLKKVQLQIAKNILSFRVHRNKKVHYKWTLYKRDEIGNQQIIQIIKVDLDSLIQEYRQEEKIIKQSQSKSKLTQSKNLIQSTKTNQSLGKSQKLRKSTISQIQRNFNFSKVLKAQFPKSQVTLSFVFCISAIQEQIAQIVQQFHMKQKLDLLGNCFNLTSQIKQTNSKHFQNGHLKSITEELEHSGKTVLGEKLNDSIKEKSLKKSDVANKSQSQKSDKSMKDRNKGNIFQNLFPSKKIPQQSQILKQSQNGIQKYSSSGKGSQMHIQISPTNSSPKNQPLSTNKLSNISNSNYQIKQNTLPHSAQNKYQQQNNQLKASKTSKNENYKQKKDQFEQQKVIFIKKQQRQNDLKNSNSPKNIKNDYEYSIRQSVINKTGGVNNLQINNIHDRDLISTSPAGSKLRLSVLKSQNKGTPSERSYLKLDDIILNDKRISVSDNNSQWVKTSKSKTDDYQSKGSISQKIDKKIKSNLKDNNSGQSLDLASKFIPQAPQVSKPNFDDFEDTDYKYKKNIDLGLKRKSTVELSSKVDDFRLSTKPRSMDEQKIRATMDQISAQTNIKNESKLQQDSFIQEAQLSNKNKLLKQLNSSNIQMKYNINIPSMIPEEFQFTKSGQFDFNSKTNSNSEKKSSLQQYNFGEWGQGLSSIDQKSQQQQVNWIDHKFNKLSVVFSPYTSFISEKFQKSQIFGPTYNQYIKPQVSLKRFVLLILLILFLFFLQSLSTQKKIKSPHVKRVQRDKNKPKIKPKQQIAKPKKKQEKRKKMKTSYRY